MLLTSIDPGNVHDIIPTPPTAVPLDWRYHCWQVESQFQSHYHTVEYWTIHCTGYRGRDGAFVTHRGFYTNALDYNTNNDFTTTSISINEDTLTSFATCLPPIALTA